MIAQEIGWRGTRPAGVGNHREWLSGNGIIFVGMVCYVIGDCQVILPTYTPVQEAN